MWPFSMKCGSSAHGRDQAHQPRPGLEALDREAAGPELGRDEVCTGGRGPGPVLGRPSHDLLAEPDEPVAPAVDLGPGAVAEADHTGFPHRSAIIAPKTRVQVTICSTDVQRSAEPSVNPPPGP
jgi:hypothetical protein